MLYKKLYIILKWELRDPLRNPLLLELPGWKVTSSMWLKCKKSGGRSTRTSRFSMIAVGWPWNKPVLNGSHVEMQRKAGKRQDLLEAKASDGLCQPTRFGLDIRITLTSWLCRSQEHKIPNASCSRYADVTEFKSDCRTRKGILWLKLKSQRGMDKAMGAFRGWAGGVWWS